MTINYVKTCVLWFLDIFSILQRRIYDVDFIWCKKLSELQRRI